MAYAYTTRPVNVRLPEWAFEVVEQRSQATKESKTEVIIEAISCLRDREIQALMAEGYREQVQTAREIAEGMLPAATDTLPEW